MQVNLRIGIWNANGLSRHALEFEHFLHANLIDIALVSETHFSSKSFFRIKGFDTVCANHPDDRAHGGSAIIIKSNIKYDIQQPIEKNYLQSAIISVKSDFYNICIAAIYFPPRHNVKCQEFKNFFDSLGSKFIVGGDFNAKHPFWGSRLSNPKGKELYKTLLEKNYKSLSTGSPTYWPSDPCKIPDLLDFVVYKGFPEECFILNDSNDLSSDHSPLILYFDRIVKTFSQNPKITSKLTNIDKFQSHLEQNISLNIPLKTYRDIDVAVENLTKSIHEAGLISTPSQNQHNNISIEYDIEIKKLIAHKRKLRKKWQLSRHPNDKTLLNRTTKDLKQKIFNFKNECTGKFLSSLGTRTDESSLWKATKYLKRPTLPNLPIKNENGIWCRTNKKKADCFANHLKNVFQPFSYCSDSHRKEVIDFLDSSCQMDLPIRNIKLSEVLNEVVKLNNKKSPGYDQINGRTIKILPNKCLLLLTYIFNAVLRLSYFPSQWKCAEIIMIKKPNKPVGVLTSYRPISLLPVFSKIFERIFLSRLLPILENRDIIPEHQFGFRHKHGTPEQCHRIVNYISDTLESKKYCSAVFLDVQQAFDRVWHIGLLYKIKKILPAPFFLFLQNYLTFRHFYVKIREDHSDLFEIKAGIPQGSVLGPVLYTIYTSDLQVDRNVLIATYADDTAVLASCNSRLLATTKVQNAVKKIENWFQTWNMAINAEKSVNVTFTLNKGDCGSIYINQREIPKSNTVKYLGMHLDRRLTWKNHIQAKRKQLNAKTKKMYWLLGENSKLRVENKILLYKCILKPIWTYGIQLWGTASRSNIKILERYQSKTLRFLLGAPWFVTNKGILRDLNMPIVAEEIKRFSASYLERLSNHTNILAITLLDDTNERHRLKRIHVLDLPFRS